MNLFYLIWFLILPIIGILFPLFTLIFYFFIVPSVAKMLIWNKFRNVSIHAVHDDAGYVELVPTKERLPEGIERTKHSWRLLPRAGKDQHYPPEEKLLLRKYTLKDYGKPFWIGHAGKIVSMNGGALAGMQQTENNPNNPNIQFTKIVEYLKSLPSPFKGIKKDLTKMLDELKTQVEAKPYTLVDPTIIKNVVDELYPPSMMDAFAKNREEKGRRSAGKQHTMLMLGIIGIIGVVIIGIALILTLR